MNQPTTPTEPGRLEGKAILLALEPSSLNELVIPPLVEAGLEIKIAASLEDAIQRLTVSAPEFLLLSEGFSTHQPHLNPLLDFIRPDAGLIPADPFCDLGRRLGQHP